MAVKSIVIPFWLIECIHSINWLMSEAATKLKQFKAHKTNPDISRDLFSPLFGLRERGSNGI